MTQPHLPPTVSIDSTFCGLGKTTTLIEHTVEIIKNPSDRLVLAFPTVLVALEVLSTLKHMLPERYFKERVGKFFNMTKQQIHDIGVLLGSQNHPLVAAAHAYSGQAKAAIRHDHCACVTTHTTAKLRLNEWGRDSTLVCDEIPIGLLTCSRISDNVDDYKGMMDAAALDQKHPLYAGLKKLGASVASGHTGLHRFDYTTKRGKTTKHCLEYWDLPNWPLKEIVFLSAMARMTMLRPLEILCKTQFNWLNEEEAYQQEHEAMLRVHLFSMYDELIDLSSKAGHNTQKGNEASIALKEEVLRRNGFMIGFKCEERDIDKNVRFNCAGVNSLRDATVAGIDGVGRAAPEFLHGLMGLFPFGEGLNFIHRNQAQAIVQPLWRGGIRDGKEMWVGVPSVDAVRRLEMVAHRKMEIEHVVFPKSTKPVALPAQEDLTEEERERLEAFRAQDDETEYDEEMIEFYARGER
jgi:hypothetical protein